nr:pectate lyase [Natronorubrum halophilum]
MSDDESSADDDDTPEIITMKAAGADIWNQSDLGHFYYTTATGDFDVTVEVASLENVNPHAKAGIMVRESLESSSRNMMVRDRAGFGMSPQWRPQDNAETTSTTSEDGAPLSRVDGGTMDGSWQRLERSGDKLRAYGSEDGEDWTLMVELTPSELDLSDEVYLGLAATSHDQANATTAKFRYLEGVEPDENDDIGSPLVEGSVSVDQVAVVSTAEPEDLGPTSATLTGTVENLGGAESVDVSFGYREVTADEWQETEATTVSETGEFSIDVTGLTARRYYQFHAVADNGDGEASTVNDLFSTPSDSSGGAGDGPESASAFDPGDGFVDVAPWLDDDTPVIVVDEPTREALETATSVDGPRVVAFETSGTIDLGAVDLNVRNGKCWIAGQTAPSPGITLTRGGIWLYGDDCVVQHVRVRPGDAGQEPGSGWEPDAIQTADDSVNQLIDHCTGTWSVDENINAGYDTENTTISNCLAAEPLNDATHAKGEHGYNSIMGNNAKRVSLMGNVWALGTDRNPRLKTGTETVVVNNLIHHYDDGMWADPDTEHSIEGNVFEDPQSNQANIFGQGSVYAADNVLEGASNQMVGDQITQLSSRPLWPDALEAIPSGDVKAHNLENAGARPADRTEHDERILDHVRNGTGGVIDSQEEVGGYPDLEVNTESVDDPETGLRAWLREQALAVEQ